MTQVPTPAYRPATADLVYGDPVVTEQGTTVLPVCRVRGARAVPLGVFVLNGDRATWTPAVDANRIAQLGVLTGLVAAGLSCLAVLRRPPWPDITITRRR